MKKINIIEKLKSLVKKVMMLIYWVRHRKEYPNSKKLNIKNILNFAEASFQTFKSNAGICEPHIKEQAIYRLELVKNKSAICLETFAFCNVCRKQGIPGDNCIYCKQSTYNLLPGKRCKECGCDTIELAFGKKPCEGKCYPERMNNDEWNEFKKLNNINIC